MTEDQSRRRVLLLFIHGLGGDSTTWGSFPDLLKSDPALKQIIDLEFYRYPTKVIRLPWTKQSVRIQDLSRALRTEIGVRFNAYSDVIVIAHSMGGVIAQKYIVDELKEKRELRVKGLVLFAVPTAGAQLAGWADLVSFRHRHLKQLRKESDLLEAIREDWRHLDCRNALKTLFVFGAQDTVVPYLASTGERFEYIAHEDHQSIVKPRSDASTSFLLLRSFLVDNFSSVANQRTENGNERHKDTLPVRLPKPSNGVLFDAYRPEIEKYYVVRREDAVVAEYISRQNLWLYGPSGYGKSAALTRSLAQIERYRIVSLGHHIGGGVKELFVAIHEALAPYDAPINDAPSLPWPKLIQAICDQLASLCQTGTKWILIEEMPLGTADQLGEFLTRLSSLLILHNQLRVPERIAFAFSSINDPRAGVEDLHRVSQILKVVRFSEWRSQDIERLLALLMRELEVELSIADQQRLLAEPAMSPRFMKVFFGNYLNLLPMNSDPKHSLEEALATTRSEVRT